MFSYLHSSSSSIFIISFIIQTFVTTHTRGTHNTINGTKRSLKECVLKNWENIKESFFFVFSSHVVNSNQNFFISKSSLVKLSVLHHTFFFLGTLKLWVWLIIDESKKVSDLLWILLCILSIDSKENTFQESNFQCFHFRLIDFKIL